jgi:glutamate synthase (NADPH/NADH) small chain
VQSTGKQLFERQADTGKKIAVVGAGPAGMACAHQLSMLGNSVTVFEDKNKAGGLNEYGIAAYKTVDDFAQKEIQYIMDLGGIEIKTGMALGRDLTLGNLQKDFDAVFLAVGLAGVRALDLENECADGIQDAVDYISVLRQSDDLKNLSVGDNVVVIGGGMTAIDIAVQSKRLGAKRVAIIYRRGPDEMGASDVERKFAQTNGVDIHFWSKISQIVTNNNAVSEIVIEETKLAEGELKGTGKMHTMQTDSLFKAVGQLLDNEVDGINQLQCDRAKIVVDINRRTSSEGVWAGGDCIDNGYDLVVAAVEDGKIAARDIHQSING